MIGEGKNTIGEFIRHLEEASRLLDELADTNPRAIAKAGETIAADQASLGGSPERAGQRFLALASTYLSYSGWIRTPLPK
jgi:hypothetical protein